MKSNGAQTKPTTVGDTIETDSGGGEMIAVARAQRELIDTLARLVLAAVESESAASHMQRPRVRTRGRRSRKPDV